MTLEKDELAFSISQVAKMVGVSAATIRNWEKSGLFVSRRAVNGYRYFTMSDIEALKLMHNRPSHGDAQAGDVAPTLSMAEARPMLSKSLLGKKWKKSRKALGYSIDYVAKQTGISASYVYKIENGQAKNISFNVLQTLAGFYGEDVLYYYEKGNHPGDPLVRAGEGDPLSNNLPGVSLKSLKRVPGGMLSIMRFTVEPGCGQLTTVSHSGEEAVHVLEGTVKFKLHDAEYILQQGDSLHFNAQLYHCWKNIGEKEASMFWVYTHDDDRTGWNGE